MEKEEVDQVQGSNAKLAHTSGILPRSNIDEGFDVT